MPSAFNHSDSVATLEDSDYDPRNPSTSINKARMLSSVNGPIDTKNNGLRQTASSNQGILNFLKAPKNDIKSTGPRKIETFEDMNSDEHVKEVQEFFFKKQFLVISLCTISFVSS